MPSPIISWDQFLDSVKRPTGLGRRIDRDPGQLSSVRALANESLFLIAGPGTGKTTALALRILKLILVDGINPTEILATTFTKKAANELRSRVLGWGERLTQDLIAANSTDRQLIQRLRSVDVNQITTGTLDSIAENVLTKFRELGTQPPIVLESFVASAILQRQTWRGGRHRNLNLDSYLASIADRPWITSAERLELSREYRDRLLHDRVDTNRLRAAKSTSEPGVPVLLDLLHDYEIELANRLSVDFSGLESRFLEALQQSRVNRFVDTLRVVLVDEYQDTNLLQEQIYFSIAQTCVTKGGSITVVGDDDQSLYRLRGATVELFVDFPRRLNRHTGIRAAMIPLQRNYRSTPKIVSLVNQFAGLDRRYRAARVKNKPALQSVRPFRENLPILGIFRATPVELADEVANFLEAVFQGAGFPVRKGRGSARIERHSTTGKIGDCAFLCSSPREVKSGGEARFPLLLRQSLAALATPIHVFNPRGRELANILQVQQLCGLILECIDPNEVRQGAERIPRSVAQTLTGWRQAAQTYIALDPTPHWSRQRGTLSAFVHAWQSRTPQRAGRWPNDVPLLQLLYDLITWIPIFQGDPEGLVYLEAVSRVITQTSPILSYKAAIQRDSPHEERSVKQIIWNIFVPIAAGAVDVNEDLLEQLPSDRLNILSIHQAKGLEFPITIVDVSCDFSRNHHKQAFKRFPSKQGRTQNLEDEVRPFSRGLPRQIRAGLDRAFDDLVRQYFVAFSRPQDLLVIVGQGDKTSGPSPRIPNIGVGFSRDGSWPWSGMRDFTFV